MTDLSADAERLHDDTPPLKERKPFGLADVFAILVLVLLTAFFFGPLAQEPNSLLVGPQNEGNNDLTSQFVMFRTYPRHELARSGEVARWNPYLLCGTPTLGSPQWAAFYPLNWLFYVIPSVGLASWLMVFHHFLAGVGTYVLCRYYRLSWLGSLLGGVIFLAAPYYLAHTAEGHYNQTCVVAWIPWTFLAYERFRNHQFAGGPLVALMLALGFFGGHVQEVYYLTLILTAFLLVECVKLAWSGSLNNASKLFGQWVLVGCLTAGLVAIELIPNAIYSQQSFRQGGMSVQIAGVGLQLHHLWQLLNPFALGTPGSHPHVQFYWERLCYFGIVPLMLAIVGSFLRKPHLPASRYLVLGLVLFAFAFGASSPVFVAIHSVVPGVSLFRSPSRALFFCSLIVALLAASTISSLTQAATLDRRRFVLGGLLVGGCIAVSYFGPDLLLAMNQFATSQLPIDSTLSAELLTQRTLGNPLTWIWLGGSILLGVLTLVIPKTRAWCACGFLLLCVLELGWHSQAVMRTIPADNYRTDSEVVDYLAERNRGFRVMAAQDVLSDREAGQAGLAKFQAYEPVPLMRYLSVMNAMGINGENPLDLLIGFQQFDAKALHQPLVDLLGTRYAVQPVPGTPTSDSPSWKIVKRCQLREQVAFRGQTPRTLAVEIWENPNALPRAFVVGDVKVVSAQEPIMKALREFDPRREVLLSQDVLPEGDRSDFQPATISEATANRVVIEVTVDAPGYLCISDTWYPGWTATAHGTPTQILLANGAFRAVPLVSAGSHRVVMEFTPPGYRMGRLVSLSTVVILIISMIPWQKHESADNSEDTIGT